MLFRSSDPALRQETIIRCMLNHMQEVSMASQPDGLALASSAGTECGSRSNSEHSGETEGYDGGKRRFFMLRKHTPRAEDFDVRIDSWREETEVCRGSTNYWSPLIRHQDATEELKELEKEQQQLLIQADTLELSGPHDITFEMREKLEMPIERDTNAEVETSHGPKASFQDAPHPGRNDDTLGPEYKIQMNWEGSRHGVPESLHTDTEYERSRRRGLPCVFSYFHGSGLDPTRDCSTRKRYISTLW